MPRPKINLSIISKELEKLILERTTITKLSEAIGISRQTIYDCLKSGRIAPRTSVKIAQELKLTPQEVDLFLSKKRTLEMVITVEVRERL